MSMPDRFADLLLIHLAIIIEHHYTWESQTENKQKCY